MAASDNYLNISELREIEEIESDLHHNRKARIELMARKERIKHRGVARAAAAERAIRKRIEEIECRRVIV